MPFASSTTLRLDDHGPILEIQVRPIGAALARLVNEGKRADDLILQLNAMIDTGTRRSVIKEGLVSKLGIYPVDSIPVFTPTSNNVMCDVYALDILLPCDTPAHTLSVIEAPLAGQNIDFLIGRDILRHGLFLYQGFNDSFTLSM